MHKLDIDSIFKNLNYKVCRIVKFTETEAVLFCHNVNITCNQILASCLEPLNKEIYTIRITNESNEKHIYVDFMDKNNQIYRFNLYGKMPIYNNIKVKNSFLIGVIEKIVKTNIFGKSYLIRLICTLDDLIMQYVGKR